MPQLGGKTGLINEAVNQHTNEQLTSAIEYMATKEYQKTRSTNPDDVIPTHRRAAGPAKHVLDAHFQVHTNDKTGDGGAVGAGGEEEGDDDDEELATLRNARMTKIKKQNEKLGEWTAKGHGVYREVAQDDFFASVVKEKGGSELVVVHFFHRDFARCIIIDKHMEDLAPLLLPIKFIKINVEKSPFLVEKLRVHTLPCCVLFLNDIAVDRIVGFEGLEVNEKGDDFTAESFKHRIEVGLNLVEE